MSIWCACRPFSVPVSWSTFIWPCWPHHHECINLILTEHENTYLRFLKSFPLIALWKTMLKWVKPASNYPRIQSKTCFFQAMTSQSGTFIISVPQNTVLKWKQVKPMEEHVAHMNNSIYVAGFVFINLWNNYVLPPLTAVKRPYNLCSLKYHKCIILQFCRSEVQNRSNQAKTKVSTGQLSLWRS